MLNLGLANELLKKVSKYTRNKINLMDTSGIIVGSTRKECRGIVHVIAQEILQSGQEEIVVVPDDSYSIKNIEPGIYMPLVAGGNKVGVLAVVGLGDELHDTAHMIRLCIETMLDFELYKHENSLNVLESERHIHQLLYDSKISRESIKYIVHETGIQPETVRIPILLVVHRATTGDKEEGNVILSAIYTDEAYSPNDLLGRTLDGNVIWYKCVPLRYLEEPMGYKEMLEQDVARIIAKLKNEIWYSAYIGPMLHKLQHYHMAYMQCEWMRLTICMVGVYYFYEHILHYLNSRISRVEEETIFAAIGDHLDDVFLENYKEMVGAMIESDYNFAEIAEKLYVHKNTAVYRFDKIRNHMHMNPLGKNGDREFMECLYYYLRASTQDTQEAKSKETR